jgi:hypothetical protein
MEMHVNPGYGEGFYAGCEFAVKASDGAASRFKYKPDENFVASTELKKIHEIEWEWLRDILHDKLEGKSEAYFDGFFAGAFYTMDFLEDTILLRNEMMPSTIFSNS